ncbi:DUF1983 domain-containing protein [Escherichia coli]|nr:DUF1983 domain-containing protein [Escherichia coli]EFC8798284.1 DUF1983 domain-containing protein [Escherichia coli]EFF9449349.1 DUF1983 domain-containing protein [Escherichia coli]EFH7176193.1 DUF1983 domain-containing protein [Escherichia coli]
MEVNKKQLADIFGASIRTIQNWQEQGMPVLRGGGKGNEVLYDSAAAIKWYAERDAEIENEKLRREVEELRQDSETDLQPGTIEYERHRLTRAQADAQELKNARDSAEVVETAFCTFVLSRIAGEIASILDGIADIRQVETTARYLGTALYWIAASINIKPGHDYYFYIRSVNTVGRSAFVEAVGRASDDAEGYLDFFKGQITESHLGKELLEKVELTEDNASKLEEFSKEWQDANDKWNAMWGVKIEQTEDGKHYVAGLGLSMEDTEEGKLSQFLVAANRIAFIDPANGNETPMFVAQGNQIFMNEVFLKYLTAPTITSGGNPPVFSLTPDGRLTAKNADISGNVNANSGTLNNVTINQNCRIMGKLSANQIEGDIVKTVGKAFPRNGSYASGTITVTVYDDQAFDRQIVIPPVLFRGGKHENFNSNNQQSYWYSTCKLQVLKNGQEIFQQPATDVSRVFSSVIDMPAGHGHVTLTFNVSSYGANNWTPTTSISDLLVVVMKKSTAGISIS